MGGGLVLSDLSVGNSYAHSLGCLSERPHGERGIVKFEEVLGVFKAAPQSEARCHLWDGCKRVRCYGDAAGQVGLQ